jgi:Uncharacterized ABC-type transport system, periplasmic component/surface lipoprotein
LQKVIKTIIAAGAAAMMLTACSSGAPSATSAAPSSSAAETSAAAPSIKVGMAYDVGGRGDQSFNDSAAAGLDKAAKEFGVDIKESAATNGEAASAREERLNQLIDAGYTNIVAVGFAYADSVKKVAAANPDVKFAIVDDSSITADNVMNLTFAANQGSFLVGAAAALTTKTKHVGFVGGVETDLIKSFEAGFDAGVKAVDPSIKIDSKYLTQPPDFSGFGDVAKGKAAAEGMYQSGADVVYHAAGGSGGGVFTAAKAAGKWAIGVDSDQALTAPEDVRDVILTSMIKRVDVGVYTFIKSVHDGSFKGGTTLFDLKADGVGYSTTGGHVDAIKDKLEAFKADIIAGKITVPEK